MIRTEIRSEESIHIQKVGSLGLENADHVGLISIHHDRLYGVEGGIWTLYEYCL